MAEMSRYVARLSLKCLARPSMASIASLERGFHGRAPVDHSNVPSFSSLVAKRSAGVFSMGAASSLGGVSPRPRYCLAPTLGTNPARGAARKFAELLRKRSGSPQGLSVAMENLKPQLLRSLRQMEHGPISVVMRSLGDLGAALGFWNMIASVLLYRADILVLMGLSAVCRSHGRRNMCGAFAAVERTAIWTGYFPPASNRLHPLV
eukprot:1458202-Rhodomonas_salina.3